jgi:hypothetical protein
MSRIPTYGSSTPDDRMTVDCLYCGKPNEVGRKAMSVTCKFCYKPLNLKDVQFKAYEARRAVETCGIVTVEKKANVVSDRVLAGGLIVRGKLKGDVTSKGPVLIGPEAELKGNVTAPTLAVGAGAILDGRYTIGQLHPPASDAPANPAG